MNNNEPTKGYGPLFQKEQPEPPARITPPGLSIWDGAELIDMYSRAEALEDGVLIDAGKLAKEAGFSFPVAFTRTVWEGFIDPGAMGMGQSIDGRLWDTLQLLRRAIKPRPWEEHDALRCISSWGRKAGWRPLRRSGHSDKGRT
jgi:hypothetical protein